MIHSTDEVIRAWHDTQVLFALLLGMLLQFMMMDKRGIRIGITVVLSSIFVGLFIVPAFIEILGVDPQGKIAIAMYATSALISLEMLAMIIKIAPEAISVRIKRFLGVQNDVQN